MKKTEIIKQLKILQKHFCLKECDVCSPGYDALTEAIKIVKGVKE
jgi:hypothetical protein